MEDPVIVCPHCKTTIKLTESLAAPLLQATRADFEQRLVDNEKLMAEREAALRRQEEAIRAERASFDDEVAKRVAEQRVTIAADAKQQAELLLGKDLDDRARELADLKEVLKARDDKLAEAQKVQAEVVRKERALDDARRELDLKLEQGISSGLIAARDAAKKDAEEALGLKVKEGEQTIAALQKQIDDLKRRAEQGSQQLQGEVQELVLEGLLRAQFPSDSVLPVPKGEHGGDCLHRVTGPSGQHCGTILWESKRTKNWSDSWLTKLRGDQRAAKAEIAIVVSQALPEGIDTFDLRGDVWVTHWRTVAPVALVLRQSLLELATARQAAEGQRTKTELIYQYLTGPQFRQRVGAIVEAFTTMQDELSKEKKAITKQWAKREIQIDHVMQATMGMYGDLQGIAGNTFVEIDGLELPALSDGAGGE